jgi:type IV secretion system protein VirD4
MNFPNFLKKTEQEEPSISLLADFPRGQEGRRHLDNSLSHGYFASSEEILYNPFQDKAGHNFLGLINAKVEQVTYPNGRIDNVVTGGEAIGVADDRHLTTVAGSRAGKGRSVIIPQLLTANSSVIVNDVKGENAAVTARFRSEVLGQKVCIIDPFEITPAHCRKYRTRFNPMSLLQPENLNLVADAGLIADGVVAAASDRDPHWDETAKAVIETIALQVATGPYPEKQKNLNTVYGLLSGKYMGIEDLIAEMGDNPSLEGRIVAGARKLAEMSSRERGSVLSTARRHMKFCDYDGIQSVFDGHDFDLNELKTGKMTLYLVLPATRLSTCKGLIRMFLNLTLAMVEVEKTKPEYPILAILDELPVLGYMKQLEDAIGQVAGLGLRLHCILQDLGQLKAIYGDRFESFLANSGVLNFFGNTDAFTSQWISDYLGKTTIRVAEQNVLSIADKKQGRPSQNFRNQVTELLLSSEVRRYIARSDYLNRQLVILPGQRPWVLQKANYDQHELFKGRFDEWR